MGVDPSKGKQDRTGDYSAIIMLGIDRDLCLWVNADLDNGRPVEPLASDLGQRSIVGDCLKNFKEFKPATVLWETNAFQSMAADAMLRYATARGVQMPITTVSHHIPKIQRIRGLAPFLAQKRLRIKDTPGGRLLVTQLMEFPVGDHDDGPDGLVTAIEAGNYIMYGEDTSANVVVLRG